MPHELVLPGGYVDDHGTLHRDVDLVPLSGHEEEFLAEQGETAGAVLVTALLSRCVRRIGTVSPISPDAARRLLVADRQYLLLKLREATFGDQVQATVHCPWADCGQKVDIDFSLADIPVRPTEDKGPLYTAELSAEVTLGGEGGAEYRTVTFRLPNGEDQERLAPLVGQNEAGALARLLARCIHRIGPVQHPGPELISRVSPLAHLEIQRQMETVAPQVDLTLEANCPECAREFALPFDLQEFLLAELRTSHDCLSREVHYLAYHYHWSEQEIMAMPRAKRRKYIAVLADELERSTHDV